MKKIISIISLFILAFNANAQDTIVKKDNTTIIAIVGKIGEKTIRYKSFPMIEGGEISYLINKNKVNEIRYQNGKVDDFTSISNLIDYQNNDNFPTNKGFAEINSDKLPFIDRKGNTFYLSNGLVYNNMQMSVFLKQNNLGHVWSRYSSGNKLLNIGWGLIVGGVALEIVGVVLMTTAETYSYYYTSYNYEQYYAGIALMSIGGLLETIGIPIAITGCVRKHKAINDYNNFLASRTYNQNMSFKAGVLGNGVGVTLNF